MQEQAVKAIKAEYPEADFIYVTPITGIKGSAHVEFSAPVSLDKWEAFTGLFESGKGLTAGVLADDTDPFEGV